jgi:hypothetical protein
MCNTTTFTQIYPLFLFPNIIGRKYKWSERGAAAGVAPNKIIWNLILEYIFIHKIPNLYATWLILIE